MFHYHKKIKKGHKIKINRKYDDYAVRVEPDIDFDTAVIQIHKIELFFGRRYFTSIGTWEFQRYNYLKAADSSPGCISGTTREYYGEPCNSNYKIISYQKMLKMMEGDLMPPRSMVSQDTEFKEELI